MACVLESSKRRCGGSEVGDGTSRLTEDLRELGKTLDFKFHIKLRNFDVYFTPLLNDVAIF